MILALGGFDPFSESSKGLADLLEEEERERAAVAAASKAVLHHQRPLNGVVGQSRLGTTWQPRSGPSSAFSSSSQRFSHSHPAFF